MMTFAIKQDTTPAVIVQSPGYWAGVWQRLRRDPASILCMIVLSVIVLGAVLAPWIAPHDPTLGSVLRRLKPVGTPGHILGTDELGRDMLTRLLYGGRLSLLMGFAPVLLALAIGGTLGTIAGFMGGRVNAMIMRAADVVFAFPSVLLAVAIAGALGPGVYNALVALTVVLIPPLIRVTEAATAQVRNLDFVEAARASGAGGWFSSATLSRSTARASPAVRLAKRTPAIMPTAFSICG